MTCSRTNQRTYTNNWLRPALSLFSSLNRSVCVVSFFLTFTSWSFEPMYYRILPRGFKYNLCCIHGICGSLDALLKTGKAQFRYADKPQGTWLQSYHHALINNCCTYVIAHSNQCQKAQNKYFCDFSLSVTFCILSMNTHALMTGRWDFILYSKSNTTDTTIILICHGI